MSDFPYISYYTNLYEILTNVEITLQHKYKSLRMLLEHVCREEMICVDLQATDMSARISFVSDKYDLSYREQQRLHTFRLTSNNILNQKADAKEEELLRDVKTLAFFIKKLYGEPIPDELYQLLPKQDATYNVVPFGSEKIKQMRVCFQEADSEYLYVIPVDTITDEPLRVKCDVEEYNEEFSDIAKILWKHAQLNLLDVWIDKDGILIPQIVVLDPDYLIDISALAECYRPYGGHESNYILSRLQPIENQRPLLLGSIANHFLDEWIYADNEVDYVSSMQKVFKKYAIELATCSDLEDPKLERQFFKDCRMHFDHINTTINQTFNADGYKLDRSDAVLEPSYVCEALGIQGRLDYMQRDMSSFIEMKSGKADEFGIVGKITPHINHRVQMLLYQAVLYFNMEQNHRDVRAYLLYTRYPLLYPARSSWRQVRDAISLRNKIVSREFNMQSENSIDYTSAMIQQIQADNINIKNCSGTLWNKYLKPQIDSLQQFIKALSIDERAYYFATYNFITKELYTSKSGDVNYESKRGAAALWNASLSDKIDEGSILLNLKIIENEAANIEKPHIVFSRTRYETDQVVALPNFRTGDAVLFYERNKDDDNVTNKLIFKGNIESISEETITVRLRAAQRNKQVVHLDSYYAIEPDSMDTTFRNMYLSLDSFLKTNQKRRDLLLGKREPQFDEQLYCEAMSAESDLERIVGKAIATKDYLLLVGPPGTGKTSFALRRMVEEFDASGKNILLLAYTNQAVDEICKAIERITPKISYIRLGSELSCAPQFRSHLLEEVLSECTSRRAVQNVIKSNNIFVSTVASLTGKMDVFKIKQFDVAIVDEASQILEPQLLGILTAEYGQKRGENGIEKFILIGDHKQLPAVVQQREETSKIVSEELNNLKIYNMRDALFERLYRLDYPRAKEMLLKQGRMHPEIAEFVNMNFYNGKLGSLNLIHQCEEGLPIASASLSPSMPIKELKSRILFIPSQLNNLNESNKVNHSEACIVSHLVAQIVEQYGDRFNPLSTIGVITPYRSQIALIKSKLSAYGDEQIDQILVDTVERFQGSERDIIIYSFCVNSPYQLDFLCNMLIEDNHEIDRKLNVALTRAKKQLFLTGVPSVLRLNDVYRSLLDYIETKMG